MPEHRVRAPDTPGGGSTQAPGPFPHCIPTLPGAEGSTPEETGQARDWKRGMCVCPLYFQDTAHHLCVCVCVWVGE